jgi:hypothetical protein
MSLVVAMGAGCSKSSPSSGESSTGSSAAPPASAAPVTGIAGAIKNAIAPNTQPFEGDIALSLVDASHPAPEVMSLQLKANKIRFNAGAKGQGGQAASGILLLKEKKMITVIDAQKKYMEIDLGGFGPGAAHGFPPAGAASGASAATPPKIEKTGHHETIAGHDCEDWNLVDANNHKALMCMASDVGAFDFGGMEGASFLPDFVKRGLFGDSAFPLKLVDYDSAGKEKTHVEVTHIERKPEDDALFAPPAGYTKLDLGNLGAAMGGFGGHAPRPPTP